MVRARDIGAKEASVKGDKQSIYAVFWNERVNSKNIIVIPESLVQHRVTGAEPNFS